MVNYRATEDQTFLGGDQVVELRWEDEMAEAMELIYRIQTDHSGRLSESEALQQLGGWVTDAARRAEKLSWLVAKGSPATLMVTYGGRKALDEAIASRNAVPQPYWFGGSIPYVESPTGPVLPGQNYKLYEETRQRALDLGLLTQEDIDRAVSAPKREDQSEEPEEYRELDEQIFPGRRGFAVALEYEEGHMLGGGMLEPGGYEGAYQVSAILTRRGAPNVPNVYVSDANMMEGDSHLILPEPRQEGDAVAVPLIMYSGGEGEEARFELVTNRRGRLGQVRTILRAENTDDARRRAYRLLNPFGNGQVAR